MLFEPWDLASRRAPNRVMFGPHVTNLSRGRALSERHVAYYERRARGGAGVIVTETASLHDSDWPYERAPLVTQCAEGYRTIVEAVRPHGALVVASLGHCGLQGSTTYSQGVLWAPSLVANVMTHEMPVVMSDEQIEQIRRAEIEAARIVRESGCDGVELNAGQFSLYRQFLSGLTNHRDDAWAERTRFVADALAALRGELGDLVLGLRLCGDELAPWAGLTAPIVREIIAVLDEHVDYVVIERGSIFSEAATRPDMQVAEGFNRELLMTLHDAVRESVTLVAQGSIVSPEMAEALLRDGLCGAVEMTRAQIAEPDLVAKTVGRLEGTARPCVLCNQGCQVRDVRNPLVSCAVNPSAGHEESERDLDHDANSHSLNQRVVIVGAGPAGLEAARRAALKGAAVTIRERKGVLGGALWAASQLPGRTNWRRLIDWYELEMRRLGVTVSLNDEAAPAQNVDVVASGALEGALELRDGNDGSIGVVTARDVLCTSLPTGAVVVIDPIGATVGVGVAELLAANGARVALVTPDLVAGTQLSLTGDLVGANARLAHLGVELVSHSHAVAICEGHLQIEDRYDGTITSRAADVVVHAGFEHPGRDDWSAPVIGDALAPRHVMASILEGRRVIEQLSHTVRA